MTHEEIDAEFEQGIELAQRVAARKHLNLFREDLAKYNLARHPVRVVERYGFPAVKVGSYYGYELMGDHPLIVLLRGMDVRIHGADWGHHLIGVTLNV